MIRTQCVRCGLPAEVDYPEDVLNIPCSACSGKLAAVWTPTGPIETRQPVHRGRFRRSPAENPASYPARPR